MDLTSAVFHSAELLRAEMKARGITQVDMARRVQTSTKHICLGLNGRVGMSPRLLEAIAAEMGLRVDAEVVLIPARCHTCDTLEG